MPYDVTWDATFEADPEDTDDANTLGVRGREIRKAIRERMDTDDGDASGTGDLSWVGDEHDGKHYKVTLREQASDPANVADEGYIYTKEVDSNTELFYQDEAGLVIQLTTGGVIGPTLDLTLPRGYIDGFQTRRDPVDTAHDIEISPGLCRDTDDTKGMELSSIITKQIDNPWAAGDNAGGFPSGITLTVDTWYGIFAIRKTSDGSLDAGFDVNLDASVLLADATEYLEYRRVGWFQVDGSSNILSYAQDGDWFFATVPRLIEEVTADFRTVQTLTLDCPPGPGISLHASLTGENLGAGTDAIAGTTGQVLDEADPEVEAAPGSHFRTAGGESSVVFPASGFIFPDSSKQIRVHLGGADSSQTIRVYLYGWTDRRGKL